MLRTLVIPTLGALATLSACGSRANDGRTVVTFSGSVLGAEGAILSRHVAAFEKANPDVHVVVQRTPDDATQRHQLYVQWLNARAGDPDVLQLDVIWTPEFAAAGWIMPLTRWRPDTSVFYHSTIAANMWRGELYALPWFVDVGMLYWRTDLLPHAPRSLEELASLGATPAAARRGTPPDDRPAAAPRYGFVWQGSRYEGLITGFQEILGGFGGRIMDDDGRVVVDSPEAIRALTFMRMLVRSGRSPEEVLTWHEEESRFAFQNGNALLMRNWPYAYGLMEDTAESRVAGRFSIAPMPAAPGGEPTAALGGNVLAINVNSDVADAAHRLIAFLTAPEQQIDRAATSGYPTLRTLYDDPRLARALPVPIGPVKSIVEHARPRPATPIWSQLSELLQIRLHRALTGQAEPDAALHDAAEAMNALIERTGVRELMASSGGAPR